jgi:hypothetical protein
MAAVDYTDFYILDPNYNKFNDTEIIEDDIIRLIIQKYQILVYTSNGDVMGDYNLGTNLIDLLYQTRLNGESVQEIIDGQLKRYIPEITNTNYRLNVIFEQDPENYQDVMFITLEINEFQVVNQIGNFL